MAVAHESATESHTGTTGSTNEDFFDISVPFTANSKGLLFLSFENTASDLTSAVTIDPAGANTDVPIVTGGRAVDTLTELGDCKAWFLGSGLPTTTKTVRITRTNNSGVIWAVAITVTAGGDTEVFGVLLEQENQALTEENVDDGSPGTNSVRYAGVNSGRGAVVEAGANSTLLHDIDFGTRVASTVRETTAGQGSRPVGFVAVDDDVAAVYLAVREVVSGTNFDETGRLVTITSTVSQTDNLSFGEALTVTVASTLAATDRADYVQALATTVTATVTATDSHDASEAVSVAVVATVTATDSIRNVEALAVTVASTVTGTDNLSFGESTTVTIVSTVTGTDIHSASESVTVAGTVTVTATDQVDWTDAATVTVTGTVTASDTLTATDAAAVTIVSTVTGSDILSGAPINYNETGRLVSIVSTVTATDQVDVDENVTVTVASTVTGSDLLGFSEPTTVTIVSTVTGGDLATLTDNVTVTIVATITVTDRITGPTFWQTDPAGYTANPAAYTKNPAAYVPVGPSDSPPW